MEPSSPTFVEITALPKAPNGPEMRSIRIAVATALGVELSDASSLLTALPVLLPRAMTESEANALAAKLRGFGAEIAIVQNDTLDHCSTHNEFIATEDCSQCKAPICSLCNALGRGDNLCTECSTKKRRSTTFYRARVSILLFVLACVVLYAWRDIRRRNTRNNWDRTLDVALIVVRAAPVEDSLTAAITERIPALEDTLEAEMRRYRQSGPRPFHFTVLGPVDVSQGPPTPADDGLIAAAKQSWDLSRYLSPIDSKIGIKVSQYDARVYVIVRPSTNTKNVIEGASEQGGRVGVVQVELDGGMIDFALFVTTHEMFHTLGATDRYAADGSIVIPEGLADPEQQPLYPQKQAELMARLRALSPSSGAPPDRLSDLSVGERTAKEIGWIK